jgi:hypothetical protein
MSGTDSSRLLLTLDIINIGRKHINVQANLTVGTLLDNVRDRWNLSDVQVLTPHNSPDTALPLDQPLNSLESMGVKDGATLICRPKQNQSLILSRIAEGRRIKFSRSYKRVCIIDPRSLYEFEIQWQPAIIGRHDTKDSSRNLLLAVDLTPFDTKLTVSRHHACITEINGAFQIEVLQNKNPLYVNEKRLMPGERWAITTNTNLRLGALQLVFRVTE